MEVDEYKALYDHEENYWWYVGLRDAVKAWITPKTDDYRLLDVGCGAGGFLGSLNGGKHYGMDLMDPAVQWTKKRNIQNIVRASACNIPFPDNTFDYVTCLDVLYHREVKNDVLALEEMRRVLKSGGLCIVHVPAHVGFQCRHDQRVHTRERYRPKALKRTLETAGLSIVKLSYRNTLLYPEIMALRIREKIFLTEAVKNQSALRPLPEPINQLLLATIKLENRLLTKMNFPFGISLLCVARK